MKKKLCLFSILFLSSLVLSSYTHIVDVPLQGSWGDEKDLRLPIPPPPTATLTENVLILHFTSDISDLDIEIIGGNGDFVYSNLFTVPFSGYKLEIPLSGYSGDLSVMISHPVYGYVKGQLNI